MHDGCASPGYWYLPWTSPLPIVPHPTLHSKPKPETTMIVSAFTLAFLVNSALALPSTGVTPVGPLDIFKRASSGCGTSGAASCSSTKAGSCCFEAPGVGLFDDSRMWDNG